MKKFCKRTFVFSLLFCFCMLSIASKDIKAQQAMSPLKKEEFTSYLTDDPDNNGYIFNGNPSFSNGLRVETTNIRENMNFSGKNFILEGSGQNATIATSGTIITKRRFPVVTLPFTLNNLTINDRARFIVSTGSSAIGGPPIKDPFDHFVAIEGNVIINSGGALIVSSGGTGKSIINFSNNSLITQENGVFNTTGGFDFSKSGNVYTINGGTATLDGILLQRASFENLNMGVRSGILANQVVVNGGTVNTGIGQHGNSYGIEFVEGGLLTINGGIVNLGTNISRTFFSVVTPASALLYKTIINNNSIVNFRGIYDTAFNERSGPSGAMFLADIKDADGNLIDSLTINSGTITSTAGRFSGTYGLRARTTTIEGGTFTSAGSEECVPSRPGEDCPFTHFYSNTAGVFAENGTSFNVKGGKVIFSGGTDNRDNTFVKDVYGGDLYNFNLNDATQTPQIFEANGGQAENSYGIRIRNSFTLDKGVASFQGGLGANATGAYFTSANLTGSVGATIDGIEFNDSMLTVNNGDLTVTGNATSASYGADIYNGTFNGGSVTFTHGGVNNAHGANVRGTLNLTGLNTLTVTATGSNLVNAKGINFANNSNFVINGGNFNSIGKFGIGTDIYNSTITGGTTIFTASGGANINNGYGARVRNSLTISGGTVTSNAGTLGTHNYGVYFDDNSQLTVGGGLLTTTAGLAAGSNDTDNYGANIYNATITNGNVVLNANTGNNAYGAQIRKQLQLTGGKLTATASTGSNAHGLYMADGSLLNISGGELETNSNNSQSGRYGANIYNATISGGDIKFNSGNTDGSHGALIRSNLTLENGANLKVEGNDSYNSYGLNFDDGSTFNVKGGIFESTGKAASGSNIDKATFAGGFIKFIASEANNAVHGGVIRNGLVLDGNTNLEAIGSVNTSSYGLQFQNNSIFESKNGTFTAKGNQGLGADIYKADVKGGNLHFTAGNNNAHGASIRNELSISGGVITATGGSGNTAHGLNVITNNPVNMTGGKIVGTGGSNNSNGIEILANQFNVSGNSILEFTAGNQGYGGNFNTITMNGGNAYFGLNEDAESTNNSSAVNVKGNLNLTNGVITAQGGKTAKGINFANNSKINVEGGHFIAKGGNGAIAAEIPTLEVTNSGKVRFQSGKNAHGAIIKKLTMNGGIGEFSATNLAGSSSSNNISGAHITEYAQISNNSELTFYGGSYGNYFGAIFDKGMNIDCSKIYFNGGSDIAGYGASVSGVVAANNDSEIYSTGRNGYGLHFQDNSTFEVQSSTFTARGGDAPGANIFKLDAKDSNFKFNGGHGVNAYGAVVRDELNLSNVALDAHAGSGNSSHGLYVNTNNPVNITGGRIVGFGGSNNSNGVEINADQFNVSGNTTLNFLAGDQGYGGNFKTINIDINDTFMLGLDENSESANNFSAINVRGDLNLKNGMLFAIGGKTSRAINFSNNSKLNVEGGSFSGAGGNGSVSAEIPNLEVTNSGRVSFTVGEKAHGAIINTLVMNGGQGLFRGDRLINMSSNRDTNKFGAHVTKHAQFLNNSVTSFIGGSVNNAFGALFDEGMHINNSTVEFIGGANATGYGASIVGILTSDNQSKIYAEAKKAAGLHINSSATIGGGLLVNNSTLITRSTPINVITSSNPNSVSVSSNHNDVAAIYINNEHSVDDPFYFSNSSLILEYASPEININNFYIGKIYTTNGNMEIINSNLAIKYIPTDIHVALHKGESVEAVFMETANGRIIGELESLDNKDTLTLSHKIRKIDNDKKYIITVTRSKDIDDVIDDIIDETDSGETLEFFSNSNVRSLFSALSYLSGTTGDHPLIDIVSHYDFLQTDEAFFREAKQDYWNLSPVDLTFAPSHHVKVANLASQEALKNLGLLNSDDNKFQLWASFIGNVGKTDNKTNEVLKMTDKNYGLSFGGGWAKNDDFAVGLAFHYINGRLETARNNIDTDQYGLNLVAKKYFSVKSKTIFVKADLGYDFERLTQNRLSYDTINHGKANGNSWHLGIASGFDYNVSDKLTLTPELYFNYTAYKMDDLRESNRNGLGLLNHIEDYDSLRFGARLKSDFQISPNLNAKVGVGYSRVSNDKEGIIKSHFLDFPNLNFKTKGYKQTPNNFDVTAGIAYKASDNIELKLDYSGEFAKKQRDNQLSFGVKYNF